MQVADIESTSLSEIEAVIQQGGRFVIYEYCVSAIVISVRETSELFFIRPGESAVAPGLKYTLLTLFLGWWGIPWGPIWTVRALWVNLRGGRDVTQQVTDYLRGDVPINETRPVRTSRPPRKDRRWWQLD